MEKYKEIFRFILGDYIAFFDFLNFLTEFFDQKVNVIYLHVFIICIIVIYKIIQKRVISQQ